MEREKKRQEREAKRAEREAKKQERIQKREEKEKMKEQKAKEREEKRLARIAMQESKRLKKEKMEFSPPPLGSALGGALPPALGAYPPRAALPYREPPRYPAAPRLQVLHDVLPNITPIH